MSLNDEIEDLAEQHQDELEAARQAGKDQTAAINVRKSEVFSAVRDRFGDFEGAGFEESLKVSFGTWAATIHLKDTRISTVPYNFLPFLRKPATFDSKALGWRWIVRVVPDDRGDVQLELEEIRPPRGAGSKTVYKELDDVHRYVVRRVAQEVARQRDGFYD